MFNWLRRLFGMHVHDFSKWESQVKHYSRIPHDMAERITSGWKDEIRYSVEFQERRCKECQFVERKKLKKS